MNQDLRQQVYAVCCPICGKQQMKSGDMTAEIYCKTCKIVYVANVTNRGINVFPCRRIRK